MRCPPPKETKAASGRSSNVSTHSLGESTSTTTSVLSVDEITWLVSEFSGTTATGSGAIEAWFSSVIVSPFSIVEFDSSETGSTAISALA